MKLKSLLALAAIAACGTANAQITDGTYYLRNVEAGKYVAWGAAWGTRSVLTEHGAAANITVNDGAYTIKLGCKTTNTALRPTDGFADQSGTWEIAPVGDGTYTIKGSNGYYRYDGSALPAVNGTETDNGIYWEILSPAELTAKMSAATVDNPVDATHFIKSPDFLCQDANITSGSAWNGIKNWNNGQPTFKGDFGQNTTLINNTNAEAWNMDAVDINQTLTGLPKGTYELSVYGFYRAGSYTDAATNHANGTEELKAILYAGEASVPFMSIVEAAGKIGNVGQNTTAGYIPNTNTDAAKYFAEGYYLNTLIFSVDESGKVQIGMKKDSKVNNDWVVIDNFGLKYYGDVTVAEVELAEYVKAYNEAMDAAVATQSLDMPEEAKTTLGNVITTNTIDLNNTTATNLSEATEALKQAVEDAKEAYRLYQLTIPGHDITDFALIPSTWTGQTGIVGWANHDDNLNGGSERYSGSMYTGDVMTMTINGLKPGTYTVTLYGSASTTGSRDKFEVLTGQNRAYLFANDALQSMEVYDRLEVAANTADKAVLTCGVKDDGVLKMGIQNKTLGANWFVIRLESIVYDSAELPTTDVELAVSDAQYSTFIAPFDAELPEGVKAYTVDGIGADNELVMTETTIKANTPVVLFSETPITETRTGVSQAEAATYTVGLLTGVYAPVEITEGYVLQNGDNGVNFYKVSSEDPITVPANKAYLTATSEAKVLNFSAATAIKALTTGGVEAIYDVNGVKQNKLQKGMNIIVVDGKTQKVLVK